jgi:Ser/Thr protein kinase RdoA (MazF antagonist)
LLTVNKESFFHFAGKYYALYPYVFGRSLSNKLLTPTAVTSAAEMLARIHLISFKNYPSLAKESEGDHYKKEEFLEKSGTIMKIIENKRVLDAFDRLAIKKLTLQRKLVREDRPTTQDYGLKNDHIIHGDYSLPNVFFDNSNRVSHVFDLERSKISSRILELVKSMDRFCFHTYYDEQNFSHAENYIRSYNKLYPVNKSELNGALQFSYNRKKCKLWIEEAHYIDNSVRTDELLGLDLMTLLYLYRNFSDFSSRVLSWV